MWINFMHFMLKVKIYEVTSDTPKFSSTCWFFVGWHSVIFCWPTSQHFFFMRRKWRSWSHASFISMPRRPCVLPRNCTHKDLSPTLALRPTFFQKTLILFLLLQNRHVIQTGEVSIYLLEGTPLEKEQNLKHLWYLSLLMLLIPFLLCRLAVRWRNR